MSNRFRLTLTGVVALCAWVGTAIASDSLPVSGFALLQVDPQLSAVHYQPANFPGQETSSGPERPFVSQLHGGYFNGSANNTAPFIVGLRAGPMVDKRLQVGLLVDWVHQTKNLSNILSTSQAPGGIKVDVKQDSARALMNLVPMMAFVQASGWGLLGFLPYIGAAGGYEVLVLSADDFISGKSFESTFGGWAYQVWAGVGFPLGERTKLNGELFVNEAILGRSVASTNGQSAHENVDMNGIGFRLGLSWGYHPKVKKQ
jgi:hypothetical protein